MFVWATNGFGFFFSFTFNCRFAGLCSPVQSRTIRVWLKPLLVGGTSPLPRATSLMQKNTSWRCFVRCFYIKQLSSIVSLCQREIKCIYFPVCFRQEFSARSGGFSHLAGDGRGCWSPMGEPQSPACPPWGWHQGSSSSCGLNPGLVPEGKINP